MVTSLSLGSLTILEHEQGDILHRTHDLPGKSDAHLPRVKVPGSVDEFHEFFEMIRVIRPFAAFALKNFPTLRGP